MAPLPEDRLTLSVVQSHPGYDSTRKRLASDDFRGMSADESREKGIDLLSLVGLGDRVQHNR